MSKSDIRDLTLVIDAPGGPRSVKPIGYMPNSAKAREICRMIAESAPRGSKPVFARWGSIRGEKALGYRHDELGRVYEVLNLA